jgi:hypothetical protein
MTRLPDRFIEDRAIRDAARAVLAEDIAHLRASLAEEGIASRVSSGVTGTISTRIRTGARDVLEQVRAAAGDNKGVLALVVGALVLWFARGPIIEWIEGLLEESSDDADVDMDSAGGTQPAPMGETE